MKILEDLYEGRIDLDKANAILGKEDEPSAPEGIDKKNLKRAHFVKISIRLPNEPRRINWLVRILFAFPIPVSIVNLFVRIVGSKMEKQLEETGLDAKDIRALVRYARGTRVFIDSEDARLSVKIV